MAVKKKSPPKPLDIDGLLTYAGRVLSVRAQTTNEMRAKLLRRAALKSDAEAVMAKLIENGIINDERFADSFAGWRRDNEGMGKGRVVRDLMARRVPLELAKTAAETAYSEVNEDALAAQFLVRKYRGKDLREWLARKNPDHKKHLASAYRKLRTGGFSTSAAVKALKHYTAAAEFLEDVPEELPEDE